MDARSIPQQSSSYQHHQKHERLRYEPSDLNSSSDNEQPFEEVTHMLDGGNSDVWDNLRGIFADIDAQDEGASSEQTLKKPIKKLRHLLEMHSKLYEEEKLLDKIYLGLCIEREWYLQKLQAIEAMVGPPPQIHPSENQTRASPNSSFSKAIITILYEDNEDYTLVGSKWST